MSSFEHIRTTVRAAGDMAERAASTQAGLAAAAAAESVDLADPAWAPIHGVTLDRYARLTAEVAHQHLIGAEAVEEWLAERGVARGTWAEVNGGWAERMADHEAVRTRYGLVYAAAEGG